MLQPPRLEETVNVSSLGGIDLSTTPRGLLVQLVPTKSRKNQFKGWHFLDQLVRSIDESYSDLCDNKRRR